MDIQPEETWPRKVVSCEEVPDAFRSFIEELLADADSFPYTVFIPSRREFLDRSNAKLISCFDDRLHVAEQRRKAVGATCHLFEDVNYAEMGKVLLRSWMKIFSLTGGRLDCSSFGFNLMGWELFTPIVERMRPPTGRLEPVDLASELQKFDCLKLTNYKFMNYARRSIRPGDQVIMTVLQPEIRREWLSLFNRPLFRVISFAHLSILTGKELIIVKDVERDVERSGLFDTGLRYGGMWQYIPLGRITTVSLEEREDGLLALSISLPGEDCMQSLFEASKKEEVESLLSSLSGRFQSDSLEMNSVAYMSGRSGDAPGNRVRYADSTNSTA